MILVLVLSSLAYPSYAGLLGAGTGAGSCASAPYRSDSVYWSGGCPSYAECCTEFGYCHSRADWSRKTYFRDCNGESNGLPLPAEVLRLEMIEREAGRLAADDTLLGISGGSRNQASGSGSATRAGAPTSGSRPAGSQFGGIGSPTRGSPFSSGAGSSSSPSNVGTQGSSGTFSGFPLTGSSGTTSNRGPTSVSSNTRNSPFGGSRTNGGFLSGVSKPSGGSTNTRNNFFGGSRTNGGTTSGGSRASGGSSSTRTSPFGGSRTNGGISTGGSRPSVGSTNRDNKFS